MHIEQTESYRAIYLDMLPKEFNSCLFVQFVVKSVRRLQFKLYNYPCSIRVSSVAKEIFFWLLVFFVAIFLRLRPMVALRSSVVPFF